MPAVESSIYLITPSSYPFVTTPVTVTVEPSGCNLALEILVAHELIALFKSFSIEELVLGVTQ